MTIRNHQAKGGQMRCDSHWHINNTIVLTENQYFFEKSFGNKKGPC